MKSTKTTTTTKRSRNARTPAQDRLAVRMLLADARGLLHEAAAAACDDGDPATALLRIDSAISVAYSARNTVAAMTAKK